MVNNIHEMWDLGDLNYLELLSSVLNDRHKEFRKKRKKVFFFLCCYLHRFL